MKTTLKRISKSTLSFVLAIMMIISTMLVGTLSVTAATYFTPGSTIYLDYSSHSYWGNTDNGDLALDAYFFSNSSGSTAQFVEMTILPNENKIASCVVPDGNYDSVIFTRNKTHITSFDSSYWNKTSDISYSGSGDMYKFTSDSAGEWATYGGGTGDPSGSNTIYFKNTVGWSNVYVYFYSSSYWDNSNGSGSNGIASGPNEMTPVEGTTDIYSFTYSGDYSIVSFTKDSQSNYNNFNNTEAVYRTDYDSSTPLYTPDASTSTSLNGGNTKYYNTGTWSAYSDTPTAYTITYTASGTGFTYDSTGAITLAAEGTSITISGYTEASGYEIKGYTVKTEGGEDVAVTNDTFTMPADNVTVTPTVEAVQPSDPLEGLTFTLKLFQSTTSVDTAFTGKTITFDVSSDATSGDNEPRFQIVCSNGKTYGSTQSRTAVTVDTNTDATSTSPATFSLRNYGPGTYTIEILSMSADASTLTFKVTKQGTVTPSDAVTIYVDKTYYAGLYVWSTNHSGDDGELGSFENCKGNLSDYSTTSITYNGTTSTYAVVTIDKSLFGTDTTFNMIGIGSDDNSKSGDIENLSVDNDYILSYSGSAAKYETYPPAAPVESYYIGGAFQIYDSTRTTRTATDSSSNWNVTSTAIKFTLDSENLYKLETYSTISELAEKYDGRGSDTYFLIHNGNGTYYQPTETGPSNSYDSSSSAKTLSSSNTNTEKYLYFNTDASNTGYVTLWLDTSDGYKFYYTTSTATVTSVTIYAKDGTTDAGEGASSGTEGGTAIIGETKVGTYSGTTFTESTSSVYNKDCTKYSVTVDEETPTTNLTVQTTVNETYYSSGDGYYVAGFVINGDTYAATDKGKGVFETEYIVDGSVASVEITPVYFSKAIENDGNYMTFYFDPSELPDSWGNTIGVYTYYYADSDTKKQDGSWPGQPMLKDATGTLWTKVSKYYYGSATTASTPISGITLNNYAPDPVHRAVTGLSSDNVQTYDYNDIVVASNAGYDTIRFEAKYRDRTVYKDSTFYTDDTATTTINPEDELFANGWTEFTYYDKSVKTDILGNPVDTTKDTIYIVSVGEINDSTVGEHSTNWYVYANVGGTYTKVAEGHPSDFIKRTNAEDNTAAYNAMNVAAYIGSPTLITYEGENTIYNTHRSDGRWYYIDSASTKATIEMGVQIKDENGDWVDGVNGTDGTATIGDSNETEKTFTLNESALINAIPKTGYVFDSWAIDYTGEGNYTTMDLKTPSGEIKISNNAKIVARFVPIAEGSLVINHNAYPGSALAYYYVSAILTKSDDSTDSVTNSTTGITFDISAEDKTIVITLSTRPGGINEFEAFYQRFNEGYFPLVTKDDTDLVTVAEDGTVSYSFTVQVADLFTTDKTVQMISSLNFYSNVSEKSANVTLKYNYYDRNNVLKTYIATDKLNDTYLDNNGYDLNTADGNEIIYKNAPFIDDLYKNCKWVISEQNITYSGTTVTLNAEQTVRTYTVYIVDDEYDGVIDPRYGVAYNSLLRDPNSATDINPYGLNVTAAGETFLYWSVTTTKDGKEVARCYNTTFDMRIVDDYTITAVYDDPGEGNDLVYISEPIYSREQYTENGTNYDKVYADFYLAYFPTDGTLLKDNSGYTTGILVELDKGAVLTDSNTDYTTITFDTDTTQLEGLTTSIADGKYGTYKTSDNTTRLVYNFVVDNSSYNNRNRTIHYISFNNTDNNQKYVMKAYYYVIDPEGNVQFSDPVYFNFYTIGHSEADTGQTTAA